MSFTVQRALALASGRANAQVIEGSPRVWVRVSDDATITRFWSSREGEIGGAPSDLVARTVLEAMTAREPWRVLNGLRFAGWEYWPGRPRPLSRFLDRDFARQVEGAALEVIDD
jgi:hypothetical protein